MENSEAILDWHGDGVGIKRSRIVLGEITNEMGAREPLRRASKKNVANDTQIKCPVNAKKAKDEDQVTVAAVEVKANCQLERASTETSTSRRSNSSYLSVYSRDIYKYLLSLETRYKLMEDHLGGSKVNARMRDIVVNWLFDVEKHFNLDRETVELTVSLLDRHLVHDRSVDQDNLQLVTLASLFVAIKFGETFLLDISDLKFICDYSFTGEEIIDAERRVLEVTGFNLSYPTATTFLRSIAIAAACDRNEEKLAEYYVDLSLTEYKLSSVEPSKIAATSVFVSLCLTRTTICRSVWSYDLQCHTFYSLDDLTSTVRLLIEKIQTSLDINKGGIFNKHLKQDCRLIHYIDNESYWETLKRIGLLFQPTDNH